MTATGIPTPLPQLTTPVTVLPMEAFATRTGVVQEMRQSPGVVLVQTGQTGGVTSSVCARWQLYREPGADRRDSSGRCRRHV